MLGAAIRAPRITSKNLISVIFCEAVAIYGVIVAIILSTKIEEVFPETEDGKFSDDDMFAGYAYFAAGLTTGFANLVCGSAPQSEFIFDVWLLVCALELWEAVLRCLMRRMRRCL